MGVKLGYAVTYRVQYKGFDFSNLSEELNTFLREMCPDMWDNNEVDTAYADELSISKKDVKSLIHRLNAMHESDAERLPWMESTGYTYEDIAEYFQEAYDNAEKELDYIRFKWE